jgi:hypothetical protein
VPNRILPEFQDFLLSRSLVPAKNAPFYAHWVSKFFASSNRNQDLSSNLKVQKFYQSSEIIDDGENYGKLIQTH